MQHSFMVPGARRRTALPKLALGALLALPALAGCDLDELLEVEDPFTVTPETAADTTFLLNAFAGAKAEFAVALGGIENNIGGIVMHTGLMSDELYAADNFNNRIALDRREINYDESNVESDESFRWLQRARVEALNTAGIFAGTSQRGSARHGELYNIAGYTTLMLAENFCSGVVLGRVGLDGAIVYGDRLTRDQTLDAAIVYFDSAAAITTDVTQVNTARVGKARALLGKADFAQAASVAAQVPNSYAGYDAEYSSASQRAWNAVMQFNYDERRISATRAIGTAVPGGAPGDSTFVGGEGTVNRGLPYGPRVDPRTQIANTPTPSNSGLVQVWRQEKYTDYDSDIPIATAAEARYIQAEGALAANNTASFETLINAARELQGLPALTSAQIGTTRDQRIDTLFRERAYALWLTGQRFSDMRRLVRQYNRPYGSVFPTGLTRYGQEYGTDASFPIPTEEVNRPGAQITQGLGLCLDIGA